MKILKQNLNTKKIGIFM